MKLKYLFKAVACIMAVCLSLSGTVIAQAASTDSGDVSIVDTTVNYLRNPIGIDIDSMVFGWKMESKTIGQRQTSYEIELYKADDISNVIWTSGKVESGLSTGILYDDAELDEATGYSWIVKVWDAKGVEHSSALSYFETGVTNSEEWKNAEFIQMPASSAAPIFRTEQSVDGTVKSARLYITALGVYEAYINGRQIGKTDENGKTVYDHMNPGYGNGNTSIVYQTYDVTSYLKDNSSFALSVIAGNGWNNGKDDGAMSSTVGQPAIKALMVVNYVDKDGNVKQKKIATNTAEWKGTLDGPITVNGVYYGEDYDARKELALGDYKNVGYDDSGWQSAMENENVEPPVITNSFDPIKCKYLRLSVSQTGPAVANDSENRLQIMEFEVLNTAGENVAKGVNASVNNAQEIGDQWNVGNLTDGDNGYDTDCGYTSEILGNGGKANFSLETPITIDFKFDNGTEISKINLYCRTGISSVADGICPNYPKTYSVQVSNDGEKWTDVLSNYDAGDIQNPKLNAQGLSTTEYAGMIAADKGSSGRIVDEFEQRPASVTIYTGEALQSEYEGGEIDVDSYYAYEPSADEMYKNYVEIPKNKQIFDGGITLKNGQTMIVNLGQNMTAIPEISFKSKPNTTVTMKFGEMLNDGSSVGDGATQADGPKGSLYIKSIRTARSEVQYTFATDEIETYQTKLSYFGYQYIRITATDDITIYSLRSRAVSSVSEQTGYIETNNEDVNRLFLNALFGQLSNYFTIPTDCPQRDERKSWTGDAQVFARTAMYNFNSAAFLNAYQDMISENTMISGYPGAVTSQWNYFSHWASGWSDVEIINPLVMYTQTGDINFIKSNWEAMNRYMDFLRENERAPYQAPAIQGNGFGDWLAFQGTGYEVIADYYYGYVTQLMAQMAELIGDGEKQTYYTERFSDLKNAFLKKHVKYSTKLNGDKKLVIKSGKGSSVMQNKGGTYEDNSQTALLWLLKLGYYKDDEMRNTAIKLLVENIKNENPSANSVRSEYGENTLSVGFLGSNVIAPVLSQVGRPDVSYDLLLNDSMPSWLFEVKSGATTIWERWNSYDIENGFGDQEMNSFNHFAYGSIAEWMYQYMAGITFDESNAGFKNIILQPTLDTGEKYNGEERINSVNGSYESYYGKIESIWKSSGGALSEYHAVIPANTTAVLYLPVSEEAMNGFENISGVRFIKMAEHNGIQTAQIQLYAGGYDFKIENGKLIASISDGYEVDDSIDLSEFAMAEKEQTITAPANDQYKWVWSIPICLAAVVGVFVIIKKARKRK